MVSSMTQRPAVRSATQRMRDQIASVKKHISFINEPAVAVASPEIVQDDPETTKQEDIQQQAPCATGAASVCSSDVELIPVQRVVQGQYQYQFIKRSDVAGLCDDGWEVWTPKTTSSDTSDNSDDNHRMAAEACSCESQSNKTKYADVVHLRPERCLHGWGDWDTYRPGQVVGGHENSLNWRAPSKGPLVTVLHGSGSSALNCSIEDGKLIISGALHGSFSIDLVGLGNQQSKANLTLREVIDMFREQVDEEEFKQCDFCARDEGDQAEVLFRV